MKIAPLVWMVIWVDDVGEGHGTCGHRHADAGEATLCPFEPADLPEVCAGLVRQVRDPEYMEPQRSYTAAKDRIAAAGPQLKMPWGVA